MREFTRGSLVTFLEGGVEVLGLLLMKTPFEHEPSYCILVGDVYKTVSQSAMRREVAFTKAVAQWAHFELAFMSAVTEFVRVKPFAEAGYNLSRPFEEPLGVPVDDEEWDEVEVGTGLMVKDVSGVDAPYLVVYLGREEDTGFLRIYLWLDNKVETVHPDRVCELISWLPESLKTKTGVWV